MYAFVDQPVESLSNDGRFLLWAMRGWASAIARGTCAPVALWRGFAGVGAAAALPHFHTAMALLNRDALHPIALAPMGSKAVCEDEAVLLGLWATLTMGNVDAVRATLALMAPDHVVTPVVRAMTAAGAALVLAGFGLSSLTKNVQRELK